MYIRIGIAAKHWGVSTSTLRVWEREGKIQTAFRTKGGHRRYKMTEMWRKNQPQKETEKQSRCSRVSAPKQKEDLERQKEKLLAYAQTQNVHLYKIFWDIGSGMNEERKGLQRMLKTITTQNIDEIVCTYSDRLARFGTTLMSHYCKTFGTKSISLSTPLEQTVETQLVDDVLALVTSFAGKLHRQRRKKKKKEVMR